MYFVANIIGKCFPRKIFIRHYIRRNSSGNEMFFPCLGILILPQCEYVNTYSIYYVSSKADSL